MSDVLQNNATDYKSFRVDEIDQLAQCALSHPDASIRNAAALQLRPLCHFDQWNNLQRLLNSTSNEYSIFILNKAMNFIILNEVGPSDRAQVQQFLLQFVAAKQSHLQKHTISSLLGTIAVATYLNWRSMVLTLEEEELGCTLAEKIEETFVGALPRKLAVVAFTQLVETFAKERARVAIKCIHSSFATLCLPRMFDFAMKALSEDSENTDAVKLMTAVLEFGVNRNQLPLITTRMTTEEPLHLLPIAAWLPLLGSAFTQISNLVNSSMLRATPETVTGIVDRIVVPCLNLMTGFSTLALDDNVSGEDSYGFIHSLLMFASLCVNFYSTTKQSELLHHGARIFVNVFERYADQLELDSYLPLIELLASATVDVCGRWESDSDSCALRTALLNVFASVVVHSSSEKQLDPRMARFYELLENVFRVYIEAAMAMCHLKEESTEMSVAEALIIEAENELRPVARLVLLCSVQLSPIVRSALDEALGVHDLCSRLRRGERLTEEQLTVIMALCTRNMSDLHGDDVVTQATHLVLSRLSVLICIGAIMVEHRGANSFFGESQDDMELAFRVIAFMRSLLNDDISDELLGLCLGTASASATSSATPHMGILRSIMMFSTSVVKAGYTGQSDFGATILNFVMHVLSNHSNESSLVEDVIRVLRALHTVHLGGMTRSPLLLRIPEAIALGKVGLLCAENARNVARTPLRRARKKLICCLIELGESRRVSNSDSEETEFLSTIIGLCSTLIELGDPLCIEVLCSDIRGMAKGITTQHSMLKVIQWIVNNKVKFAEILQRSPEITPHYIKLFSKVAFVCSNGKVLEEVRCNPTPTAFVSFAFDSLDYYLRGKEQHAQQFSVSELSTLARLIHSVLVGEWCNIGVMLFYNDTGIERVLHAALRTFISSSVDEVLSLMKRREMLFQSIIGSLSTKVVLKAIQSDSNHVQLALALAGFLVRCLKHTPMSIVLRALKHTYAPERVVLDVSTEEVPVEMFRELCILLSTNVIGTGPEDIPTACFLIERVHGRFPAETERVLERLLDQASAYHRVRLRSLLMMLKNPPASLHQSFASIFGRTLLPSESLLSAW